MNWIVFTLKPTSDRIRYTNQALSPKGFSSMPYKKFIDMVHTICKVNKPAEFLIAINTFKKIFINTTTGDWSVLKEDDYQFKQLEQTPMKELAAFNKKTKEEREFKKLSRVEKFQKQMDNLLEKLNK